MGNIQKVGDEYYIEFYARGLLYQQKAGKDLKKAEELLRDIEEKLAKGELQTIVREINRLTFFEQYLKSIESDFSPATLRRFQKTIEHFNGFLNAYQPLLENLSQVTPRVIELYKTFLIKSLQESPRKFNPKWVNLTLLLLREILEYGIKTGFINDNPTLHVRLLQTSSKTFLPTQRSELAKKLLNECVPLGKIYKLLDLSDIAQIMYFSIYIPLSREDIFKGSYGA